MRNPESPAADRAGLLSEDDLNLREMSPSELDQAWDLWFDLAQTTNESDPPYSHGVFVLSGTVDARRPFTKVDPPGSSD